MVVTNPRKNIITPEELFFNKIYWSNQLAGELPETNCLTDYLRTQDTIRIDQEFSFKIHPSLSKNIIKIAQGSDFSIYLLLLTSLVIFLHKYLDREQLVIGSPSYQATTNNIVPLRFKLDPQLTFQEILEQVKDITIKSYSYQDYQFPQLVEQLEISQQANRCPIFDLLIALENIHNLDSLEAINNDLTIVFAVEHDLIKGKILYKSRLFNKQTIELFSKYYLNALVANLNNISNAKISELSLITKRDRDQILQEFNHNQQEYPVTKTIDYLFESQVTKTPDRIAAIHGNNHLTYQELNQKANQLAKLLQQLTIQPGEFIAVVKERDLNFLISILAILKIGGVYIPIDSSYPTERIKYMVTNSQVKTILTDPLTLKTLPESIADCPQLKNLVCLDKKQNVGAQGLRPINKGININYLGLDSEIGNFDNLNLKRAGTDLAYTIYTSGSTGLPKGAMIRHGGAINHIYAQFDALSLTENLTFLQTAPASSDISVWQFLAPILIGGKTVIVDTETICDPPQLWQTIQQSQATLVELVPVVLQGLLEYLAKLSPEARKLPSLQWMMVTGETVAVNLVNDWLKLYPNIPVVNAYGPSEASDDITQAIIDRPLPENQRLVPIGKPLANLNLHILDSNLKLLPIGVPGEICVSGYGVGVGYWDNQEKTQGSFVPNPFPEIAKPLPGVTADLLYKTGDQGRWLSDGSIEYLGRIDNQVKIRGFRIELGEIETVLTQHQEIEMAVAIARSDDSGTKTLVAYVVPKDSSLVNNRELILELRQFLETRLPKQMIPSALMSLTALPLTPSGKIDKRALPEIQDAPREFIAPQTETEKTVAAIWGEVLKRSQISIDDDFFELGGHSLLATQVISRLREQYQQEIALRSLFENPTLGKLASYLDKIQSLQQLQTMPVETTSDREEFEL
ncbi:amino acid adenylation enzyme/thioester reductase family protein [Xenococcus sp. PCC 7305]|uniref:non-ribosomal peptide synthetase n=1 Tax=Xenococcus sp. PCC 7305 TaxID=102125 RepID=UPI0002AC2D93|nr:non-ribosomal peptide synthetase [Xenococcus sp. PCC 7305]ELS00502.1 amino acid adenylation enzyme/thioester reductase family protein [Xenococcus sp. PCC 7305]